jgi:predicted nucleotide-binding protein
VPVPTFTTPDDIERILAYLKSKPMGATKKEARAVLDAKVVDDRKMAAYQALGLIERDGDRWKLTEIGRRMARADGEDFAALLRERLLTLAPYRGCLEWAHHQGLDALPAEEVAARWHSHYREDVGADNEAGLREKAVCFLQLCAGAGLGQFRLGRRGQPSRLDLAKEPLEAAVTGAEPLADQHADRDSVVEAAEEPGQLGRKPKDLGASGGKGKGLFIAHGKNKKPLQELKSMLDGFKVPYRVVEEEPNLGRPISDQVRQTMDDCDAAIIIFTADEELRDLEGKPVWRPSENVPHELGAAGLKYGKRIVILKDTRVKLASNYSDLGYIQFDEDQLAAKSVDVIKELIGFGILKVTT